MYDKQLPSQEIPVINEADIVVIGGSFAGLSSALQFAKNGKKVMIVEPRTYLGSDMSASLSPWIKLPNKNEPLPSIFSSLLRFSRKSVMRGESQYITFHMDNLKISLEEQVEQAGIDLLYASLPIGTFSTDNGCNHLIIANKSGRQVIRCKHIVDATETAITTFLCDEPIEKGHLREKAYFKRVLEFDRVQNIEELELTVPESLTLRDNKVNIYQGYHGNGHYYVEFHLLLKAENSLDSNEARELEAEKRSMELAQYLIQNVEQFSKAIFTTSSYELKGPYFSPTNSGKDEKNTGLSLDQVKLGFPGVSCFYKDFYQNGNQLWLDPIQAAFYGEQFAILSEDLSTVKQSVSKTVNSISSSYETKTPTLLEGSFELETVPGQAILLNKKTKVLVTGGGSSGSPAAIVSGKEGMETTLVDLNPGLGGTGTYGGVDSYWFGKRHGYAERITEKVNNIQNALNYKGAKWNIEAKKYVFRSEAEKAGVKTVLNAITFGAITKVNRVLGCVSATRWGVCSIIADCVIDATGDGDLAAFAGAEYVYGSERDHVVMWYSLAQFKQPSKLQNNFTSMVNVSDIRDYTRAILAGRRRWNKDDGSRHDHGVYVAPRESRHIIGDVVMKMSDQLLQRSWPDVINVHFSNHDMKGVSGADWMNTGLIPPNLEIEIPYRMLLPKGLDGMLVVGKAISATHDALPAIRMQSDLENLGGIAALATAMAIRENKGPREIDCKALQERVVKEGLMPKQLLDRKLDFLQYSDEELEQLIESIETDEPLYEYSNMRMNEIYEGKIPFVEICSVGSRIVPLLEKAHLESTGIRKVRLAQALAMYESKEAVPTLISEIKSMINGENLPKRTADILYVTMPPDHGAMPDVCYLLYSLGMVRDKRSLEVWEAISSMVSPTEKDFEDPWWGIFYYVHAICMGAERLGDMNAIPILEQLHEIPYLQNQSRDSGYQPDYFLERRAMLELAIGRALARCGSVKGYQTLINYLHDVRSLLSMQAYTELKLLSAQSFIKQRDPWIEWLDQVKDTIVPSPYLERTDLIDDNETIYRKFLDKRD